MRNDLDFTPFSNNTVKLEVPNPFIFFINEATQGMSMPLTLTQGGQVKVGMVWTGVSSRRDLC